MAAVTIADDEDALTGAAAGHLAPAIAGAIAARGSAVVCLTGGSTPEQLYARLADAAHPWRDRIEWPRVHLFWGDERHVPPDHADSNYAMAHRALIAHVPIPADQVHRMRGEIPDARDAARDYETALADGFARAGRADRTFDVMLLGLGANAHIASIFPGSDLLQSSGPSGSLAAGVWVEEISAWRITLTPPALLDARAIVMLVSGAAKADAVHAGLRAPEDVARFPVQLLRPAGDRVAWLIDHEAAARL